VRRESLREQHTIERKRKPTVFDNKLKGRERRKKSMKERRRKTTQTDTASQRKHI
jgi:hypothetical protein